MSCNYNGTEHPLPNAFVAKFSPSGTTLAYSTYLGGSDADYGYAIAADGTGNTYVTGYTESTNFPTMNPLQATLGGGGNAFVSEINPTGSALLFSTYLGGSKYDEGYGIAVDSAGNIDLAGFTQSTNFPVTPGAFQTIYGGGYSNAFVAKINLTAAASVSLAPLDFNFGNLTLGTASSPKVSTLTNNGELTLTISSIAVAGTNKGDFAQTNNCPSSIAPNGSCTISVAFTPSVLGTETAAVSFSDNAPNSPQSLSLTGMGVQPGLYSPAPGSTLTSNSATFQWYDAPTTATAFWIDIGSSAGGNTYYQSGSLPTTTLSATVNSLPTNGSTIYVTFYYMINGTWTATPYTYTAFNVNAGRGVLTTPTPSSTLTSSTVTFDWTAGSTATAYWLDLGSSTGGNTYYQSGNLGDVLTTTVSGLPTNGTTIYATLYSLIAGSWQSNAYTYTAFNVASAGAVMTTPSPGSTLTSSTITFDWTAGTGATGYWLDLGNTPGGNTYYQSGNLGNVFNTTVSGLPTDGSTIYATLYSLIGGAWTSNSYTYTAFNNTGVLATMKTPVPSSTIDGNSATFTWTADSSATGYWLDIGSTAGGNTYYQSGNLGDVLTTTVNSLPANGTTIYVTLYSLVAGQWSSNAYTYTSGP